MSPIHHFLKKIPKIGANFPNVPKNLHVPLFQVSEMLTTGNAEGGGAVRSGRPHDYKARELNDLKYNAGARGSTEIPSLPYGGTSLWLDDACSKGE